MVNHSSKPTGRTEPEAGSTAASAEVALPIEGRGPTMNETPWQWNAIHRMLCNEPGAFGLADRAVRHPSSENAKSFAALFDSLGHAELADVCRNVRPSYEAFPSERMIRHILNEQRVPSLASATADEEVDDEPLSEADKERCYLVNNTMINWSWNDVLFFSKRDTERDEVRAIPLCGHSDTINGACCIQEENPVVNLDVFISWSNDKTLRLWRVGGGERQGPSELKRDHLLAQMYPPILSENTRVTSEVLKGHTGPVRGAFPLPDGRLVSWSDDATIRIWSRDALGPFTSQVLLGHTSPIKDVSLLRDGRLCSYDDHEVLYWS